MVQCTIPITAKGYQKSAQKNHSCALVARCPRSWLRELIKAGHIGRARLQRYSQHHFFAGIGEDCLRVGHLPVVRGDGSAESRFPHSRSPFREGDYRCRRHSVPYRDTDCPNKLLQPSMAAGRNGSKQDRIRDLVESRKYCWCWSAWHFGLRDYFLRHRTLPIISEKVPREKPLNFIRRKSRPPANWFAPPRSRGCHIQL